MMSLISGKGMKVNGTDVRTAKDILIGGKNNDSGGGSVTYLGEMILDPGQEDLVDRWMDTLGKDNPSES